MPQIPRAFRFGFQVPVHIKWGSTTLLASVRDISIDGLFLETSNLLWIGATFAANLMLQPRLQVLCTVCRIDPSRGMGVQVTFVDSESRRRFVGLLEQLGWTG
jgi:hypothetical protein